MTFRKFIQLYDNWNAYINVNDDRPKPFVHGKASQIYENVFAMDLIADKQVVGFDIDDGLLTIRLDMERGDNNV